MMNQTKELAELSRQQTAQPPALSASAMTVREVKAQVKAMHEMFKEVMEDGVHYGKIPGTPKETLYKAGAEKIGLLMRLAPSFHRDNQMDADDHLTVFSTCKLTHIPTGQVIAEAGAICSTRETKYAYRQATRKCPECGAGAIIKGKKEYGGGWICFAKKGGCGHKWPDGAQEIEGQPEQREENPNLADAYNTVLKMADKRAYVAATLFGTAASDIYTQDVEDFGDVDSPLKQTQVEKDPEDAEEYQQITAALNEQYESGGMDAVAVYWRAHSVAWRHNLPVQVFRAIVDWKDVLKARVEADEPEGWAGTGAKPPRRMHQEQAHIEMVDFREGIERAYQEDMADAWWEETGQVMYRGTTDAKVQKHMLTTARHYIGHDLAPTAAD